jgi:hypothetical protein
MDKAGETVVSHWSMDGWEPYTFAFAKEEREQTSE